MPSQSRVLPLRLVQGHLLPHFCSSVAFSAMTSLFQGGMFWGNTFWSPSAQPAVSREFMQNYVRPTSMRTLGYQIPFILLSHSRAGNRVPDATQSPTLQNHDTLSFIHPEPKVAGPACGHHFYLALSAPAPDRTEKLRPWEH